MKWSGGRGGPVGVEASPFLAPAVAALFDLKQDGKLAVGVDGDSPCGSSQTRWTRITGLLVFELRL